MFVMNIQRYEWHQDKRDVIKIAQCYTFIMLMITTTKMLRNLVELNLHLSK